MKKISWSLVLLLMLTSITPLISMAAETPVNLGTAENFAILASSTITNTGTTTITGDVGLHPGTELTDSGNLIVNGSIHLTDAVALQAKNDMVLAYTDLATRVSTPIGAELGGSVLTSGIYGADTILGITGTLTLDGENNSDSIFIIKAGSTLTTASESNVVLINGAKAKNVFWVVGSSATLGTNSIFAGSILSQESITSTTGTQITGKLMAINGAVTLDSNTITNILTSTLTVGKIVTGDTAGITLPIFEMNVTGPDNFSETQILAHNETFTWVDLTPGQYNISESRTGLNSNWTVSGETTITLESDQPQTVTITNLYTVPPIMSDPEPEPEPDPVVITPTNPVETDPIESDPVESAPIVIAPIEWPYGSLTVEKIVTGDTSHKMFEIIVTGPNGFSEAKMFAHDVSYTWDYLEPGEYVVTENRSGLNDGWVVSGERSVEVIIGEIQVVTITNHYVEAVQEDVPLTPQIPQTGQESNYKMAITLGVTALLLAGVGLMYAKNKKQSNI